MSFQKMQINKHPFLVNIIELTNKKGLVRSDVADKDKIKKILSLVVLAHQKYRKLLRRLQTKGLVRPETRGASAIG